jgi:hypothetical protein
LRRGLLIDGGGRGPWADFVSLPVLADSHLAAATRCP